MVSRLTRVDGQSRQHRRESAAPETMLLGSRDHGAMPDGAQHARLHPVGQHSHSIGTVRSAPDGRCGSARGMAPSSTAWTLAAFRSYDEQGFAGKILHIDRNGRGLPGHPFCPPTTTSPTSARRSTPRASGTRSASRCAPGRRPLLGDVGLEHLGGDRPHPRGRQELRLALLRGNHQHARLQRPRACAAEYYAKEGTLRRAAPRLRPQPGHRRSSAAPPTSASSTRPATSGTIFFGDYALGLRQAPRAERPGR